MDDKQFCRLSHLLVIRRVVLSLHDAGNILVTVVATTCMFCVTACILGMMFVVGWELGTIESISATILVGLSVDYVVHIAQAYVEVRFQFCTTDR